MSVHVLSWVLRNSSEELGNRLVLIVLSDYAGEDGHGAWPSVGTIAQETRLSERQVQRCLRNLEASGSIEGQGRTTRGVNIWRVCMGDKLSPPGADRGDTHVTGGVTPMSPDPPLEPPVEDLSEVTTVTSARPNLQNLVQGFVDEAREQGTEPPRRVVGQIAKELKNLASEGAQENELRAALSRLLDRGLHPSSLPSVLFDVRQRGSANGNDPLSDFLAAHGGKWPTGSRLVRGQGGAAYVRDPLGYDKPEHPVAWGSPDRTAVLAALRKEQA